MIKIKRFIFKEEYMSEKLQKEYQMDLENSNQKMEASMMDIGKTVFPMGLEK